MEAATSTTQPEPVLSLYVKFDQNGFRTLSKKAPGQWRQS